MDKTDKNLRVTNVLYIEGYIDGFGNAHKGLGKPLSPTDAYMLGYEDGKEDYKHWRQEQRGIPEFAVHLKVGEKLTEFKKIRYDTAN